MSIVPRIGDTLPTTPFGWLMAGDVLPSPQLSPFEGDGVFKGD